MTRRSFGPSTACTPCAQCSQRHAGRKRSQRRAPMRLQRNARALASLANTCSKFDEGVTTSCGSYRIRSVQEGDLQDVADIQTEAFYKEHAFQPIDKAFKSFFRVRSWLMPAGIPCVVCSDYQSFYYAVKKFGLHNAYAPQLSLDTSQSANLGQRSLHVQAEVLAAMQGKLKGKPGSYIILVALPVNAAGASRSVSATTPDDTDAVARSGAVGIIEVYQDTSAETAQHVGAGPDEDGIGWLASMGVAETHRRQGLGSALVAAAEEAVVAWGFKRVALNVFEDNESAVKMYAACGFVQTDSTPFVWMQWLQKRNKLLMTRELPNCLSKTG